MKLIKNMIAIACVALTFPMMAQNIDQKNTEESATAAMENSLEKYEKYFEGLTKLKFREFVINSLNLNQTEIVAFDPVLRNYLMDKYAIIDKRMSLINDYKTEIEENDSPKAENDKTVDFIQNYWDTNKEITELQKKYFVELESKLGWEKSFKFFMLEEAAQNRMILDKNYEIFPEIEKIYYYPLKNHKSMSEKEKKHKVDKEMSFRKEMNSKEEREMATTDNVNFKDGQGTAFTSKDETIKMKKSEAKGYARMAPEMNTYAEPEGSSAYKKSPKIPVETYNHWVENNTDTVSLDHTYTYNGIILLSNALESVVMHKNTGFDKGEIIQKAYKLTLDPYSTDHADFTSEIFREIASTYAAISNSPQMSSKLTEAADMIDPDELLTRQADHIKNFFYTANDALMTVGYQVDENQALSQGTE